jgi:uncharacterized membrane protein YgcG
MIVLLVVLVPIIALSVWGITFDLKRRRRRAVLTSHDIGSAARRAQANADARNVGWTGSGGGSAGSGGGGI